MYSSGETEFPTFQYICSSGGKLKSLVLQALKCIVLHEGSFARFLQAQSFSLHHFYVSYGQQPASVLVFQLFLVLTIPDFGFVAHTVLSPCFFPVRFPSICFPFSLETLILICYVSPVQFPFCSLQSLSLCFQQTLVSTFIPLQRL